MSKTSAAKYQQPDSTLTLRQGIQEYYDINPTFLDQELFLNMSRDTVRAHDVVHIVFGQSTSSADELIVETLTVLATIIPPQKYAKMIRKGFLAEVYKLFGPYLLIKRLILTLPRVLRAVWASLRMKKRWNHFEYEKYLDVKLLEIREELGIRIA